jgi:dihydroorotate dehydrogenase electron transfer subunit
VPGIWLDLLSPIGQGFAPPQASRRWLLVGMTPGVGRLLPLIPWGLAQEASIVLVTPAPPPGLAAEVEVIPEAGPAIAWADYIGVDAPSESVEALGDLLPGDAPDRRAIAEVLVAGPMPCGTGACAACAVAARPGWKLACVDGPVFKAEELLR